MKGASLESAKAAYREGREREAEAICRRVLRVEPKNADALCILGVIYLQDGKVEKAISQLSKAVQLAPEAAHFRNNLGLAYDQAAKTSLALEQFDVALVLDPDYPSALFNKGLCLQKLEQHGAAISSFDQTLLLDPSADVHIAKAQSQLVLGDNAGCMLSVQAAASAGFHSPDLILSASRILSSLGQVAYAYDLLAKYNSHRFDADVSCELSKLAMRLGDHQGAIEHSKKARDSAPQNAHYTFCHGLTLFDAGEFRQAFDVLEVCARQQSPASEVQMLLGVCLLRLRRYKDAETIFRAFLYRKSDSAEALLNLGAALHLQGNLSGAVAVYEKFISLRPDSADGYCNLGVVMRELGRDDEFARLNGKALELNCSHPDALVNAAKALEDNGRLSEAESIYRKIIESGSSSSDVRFNLGILCLLRGSFSEGWAGYEDRYWSATFNASAQSCGIDYLSRCLLRPTKEDFTKKRVLVLDEQGIGDTIMFASILPDLLAVACSVDVMVPRRLQALLARSFGRASIHSWDEKVLPDPEKFDVVCLIGSLAHAFRQDRQQFSGAPYLAADPAKVAKYKSSFARSGSALGLSWRGGTVKTRQAHRSIPLQCFAPFVHSAGFNCISLQHGQVAEEIADVGLTDLLGFGQELFHDLDELAALIEALDVLVSVQNTNVHLAGALGKRCVTLIPENPEWRYGQELSSMVWYDSVRLVRGLNSSSIETIIASALLLVRESLSTVASRG